MCAFSISSLLCDVGLSVIFSFAIISFRERERERERETDKTGCLVYFNHLYTPGFAHTY